MKTDSTPEGLRSVRSREVLSRMICSGIEKGQIKRNIKPEQFASVFASLVEGGLLLSKATGSTIQQ